MPYADSHVRTLIYTVEHCEHCAEMAAQQERWQAHISKWGKLLDESYAELSMIKDENADLRSAIEMLRNEKALAA